MNVRVADRIDSERDVVVGVDAVAPLVGAWLAADSGLGEPSPNVQSLVAALRRGDWPAVHALADHLSVSVERIA